MKKRDHIVITPGVCGGKPRIAGRRIRVQDVTIWHEKLGMSPDEIASSHHISVAAVYAALAYYFDHREEIQRDIRKDRRLASRLRRRELSVMQDKLKALRG